MKIINKYVLILLVLSSTVFAQLGGYAGSFTRMGFGARGISMGNAMTSVTYGDINGYYNPALSPFQNEHLVTLSYSFLSLDRSLNFVSYTKNFKLPNNPQGGAGFTFSWINAGVSNIDGRDADGYQIGNYSVYENQLAFAPAIRVSEKFSFGIGFKFYFSKLFDGVKSTSLGFDVGGLYKVTDKINVGVAIKDLNSKYSWNTASVYGQDNGSITTDRFPVLYNLGVSYLLPKDLGVVSLEYENSNQKENVFKAGGEVNFMKDFSFRAGVDRFDLSSKDIFGNSKIMFGVGFQKPLGKTTLGINYSFELEPYTHNPFQTLTAVFKIL
ncbi:MAG: hypothetical protein ACHQJ4_05545 [Ignavibacteria bacterium]